jgi:hypothetical protein
LNFFNLVFIKRDNMMQVSGKAMVSIPLFILKKFGRDKYKLWLDELSSDAKKVYSTAINKNEWFPLKEIMSEPSRKICDLFYNRSLRGAWECGRFSAEYGLKGIYKVLAKLASPAVLIKKQAIYSPRITNPAVLKSLKRKRILLSST